jgi:hypothetical protein
MGASGDKQNGLILSIAAEVRHCQTISARTKGSLQKKGAEISISLLKIKVFGSLEMLRNNEYKSRKLLLFKGGFFLLCPREWRFSP